MLAQTLAAYEMRVIKLEKYNVQWIARFEHETTAIKRKLPGLVVASHHIGSTAIKGIMSKPTIDIIIEVKNLKEIDDKTTVFKGFGYLAKGEYGIKDRRFFYKGENERTHHIHIFESGSPQIYKHLIFVKYMNANPDKARQYEQLKIELAEQYMMEPDKYSEGKSSFINLMTAEAMSWQNG